MVRSFYEGRGEQVCPLFALALFSDPRYLLCAPSQSAAARYNLLTFWILPRL